MSASFRLYRASHVRGACDWPLVVASYVIDLLNSQEDKAADLARQSRIPLSGIAFWPRPLVLQLVCKRPQSERVRESMANVKNAGHCSDPSIVQQNREFDPIILSGEMVVFYCRMQFFAV